MITDWSRWLAAEAIDVEWKESDTDSDGILRAVCAMANDLAGRKSVGVVVLGIRNKAGQVVGLPYQTPEQRDHARLNLANRLSSVKIMPSPSFVLDERELDGHYVLAIVVHPAQVPPIVKVDGVAWVRPTAQTRKATAADLAVLQERRPQAQWPFDARPAMVATLDDLQLEPLHQQWTVARDTDDEPESFPEFPSWLRQLGLAVSIDGVWRPTWAGILCHGIDPQNLLPGARVELVRYSGDDYEAQPLLRKPLTGSLPRQLQAGWETLADWNTLRPMAAHDIQEPLAEFLPQACLKELLRNSVQHRMYDSSAPARVEWFDSHVVFSNPGGPFGQASTPPFGDHSDYRNPIITGELVRLGHVQQLGRGVRRANLALQRAELEPMQVEVDGFTRITVKGRP
jgi:ATP-dependent DNA helicase RecG